MLPSDAKVEECLGAVYQWCMAVIGDPAVNKVEEEVDLTLQPIGDAAKVKIAEQLRSGTPKTREWIAGRLRMGSASYVSNLLSCVDSKL